VGVVDVHHVRYRANIRESVEEKKKKKKEKKKTDIPERGFDLSADRSSQGTTGHDSEEEEEKKKKEKTNENNNDNGSSNSNKKTKQNKAGPSH
jgi:hypothetical protein